MSNNSTNNKKKAASGGFQSLGLSPLMFRGVMAMGYKVPTPIQRKALPMVLSGRDVVAMARTGSGKTAAFLIPLIEKLKEHSRKVGVRGVILSPTRELAVQTFKFLRAMAKFTTLKVAQVVGGDAMDQQFEDLASNPDVIVATPGRLMHHLQEIPEFNLRSVEYVVFDEADRIFEMGFALQLNEILKEMPDGRQTVLFSATLPKALVQFARAGLSDPELIRLDVDNKISDQLKMSFFSIRPDDKTAALVYLIRDFISSEDQTIVFAATRHHVEFLYQVLLVEGIESSCVYGDMDQTCRKINIGKFRARKTRVLIVTDVAARGIDIPLLNNVVNYNFPPTPKLFVHRVGRAARAGRSGAAFSFVEADEVAYMADLYLYLGRKFEDACVKEVSYSLQNMEVEQVHLGTLPRTLLDAETEHMRELLIRNTHITPLIKVCKNALSQYIRTRPDPSKQSIRRSKALVEAVSTVHPLFRSQMNDAAIDQASYLTKLTSFRPNQTIFEVATGSHSLKKNCPGVLMMKDKRFEKKKMQMQMPLPIDEAVNDTQRKNATTTSASSSSSSNEVPVVQNKSDDVVGEKRRPISKAERKKMKKLKTNSVADVITTSSTTATKKEDSDNDVTDSESAFQDKENYISYMKDSERLTETILRSNGDNTRGNSSFVNSRLEEAILDVNPDEAIKMNDKRRLMHWDARKKKYINTTVGELRSGDLNRRNESGARVKRPKSGSIYKKWQQQQNKRVGVQGAEEDEKRGGNRAGSGGLDYRFGKKPKLPSMRSTSSVDNNRQQKNAKNELLDEASIRKEENRKARSQGKHNTGGKPLKTKRGKGNVKGKSHGAPTRSKAIYRR